MTQKPRLHRAFWAGKYSGASFLTLAALIVLLIALLPGSALAQIVPTSRLELTDPKSHITLAPYLYVTEDGAQSFTAEQIIARHRNNQRGQQYDSALMHLGIGGNTHWMVFSVTNHTSQEEWLLDFGNIYDGRSGFLRQLFIKNIDTGQVFAAIGGPKDQPSLANNMGVSSVRIALPAKKTSLIALSLRMDGGIINTIHPVLKSANPYHSAFDLSSLLSDATIILFMVMAGFFIAIGAIRDNVNYYVFSAFYFLSGACFTVLEYSFFKGLFINMHFANLLLFGSMVAATFATRGFLKLDDKDVTDLKICTVVLAVLCFAFVVKTFAAQFSPLIDLALFALPIALSFLAMAYVSYSQSQYGKYGALFLAFAWLFPAAGILITSLSSHEYIALNSVFINAYWLSLLGHAGFFIAATVQKIRMLDEEERQGYILKNKKALQKVKAVQERETADQAKLLRVIERERELMAGLRELEIHRAEEMRRAKDEADAANRAKSAFLAVVSHEVRTPMTGILGMVRLLLESKLSPEQNDFVLALQKSGETMMALLNDILDFEKIESGNMELEYLDFNLPQLVKDVVTLMSGHAAEKEIELKADIDDNCPVYVLGDPTRLRQVLLNLVNNAIKFTAEGSVTIQLEARKITEKTQGVRGDYEITCAVQDTGIGISEEGQKALFDPFSQADSSISRKYGGTGLGLTICKKLIEAMGSTIQVTSQENQGSRFFFTLLMEEGSAEKADSLDKPDKKKKQSLPTKRILVVEDNEMNRKVLQGFLERHSQITTMAENGEKAIALCRENPFDIILMDIQLPDMSGIEVTQELRKLNQHNTDRTPIIALTGNVMLDDIKHYYDATMNGFLAKPIDHDKLYETILNIHEGKLDNPVFKQQDGALTPEAPEVSLPSLDEVAMELESGSEIEEIDTFDLSLQATVKESIEETSDAPEEAKGGEPAPDAQDDLLDFTMLDSLLNNLGREQCENLMQGFMDKATELVDTLRGYAENGETSDIQARAHELKGMAANFGLKKLSEDAGVIEKCAKDKKIEEALAAIATLEESKSRSQSALEAWLQQS